MNPAYPEIDWNVCQGCDPCQARLVCKTRAIVQPDPGEPPYVDFSRCTRCALCAAACPCQAITTRNGHERKD